MHLNSADFEPAMILAIARLCSNEEEAWSYNYTKVYLDFISVCAIRAGCTILVKYKIQGNKQSEFFFQYRKLTEIVYHN